MSNVEGGQRTRGIYKKEALEMPLITVITVVYNNVGLLEKTIQSVLNQTYDPIEYIIIDGGSTDGTLGVIKKYDDRVAYWISEKDEGLYDAMNKGIKLAKGEWIHILNSDDTYISPNVLERIAKNLQDPDRHFYYCTMLQDFGTRKNVYKFRYNFIKRYTLNYSAYLPHPTMLVAKSQYEKIGLFDTHFKFAADHDLTLRLCKDFTPKFIDIPMTEMRLDGLTSRNIEKSFREFKEVTIKNGFSPFLANLFFRIKVKKYNFLNKK